MGAFERDWHRAAGGLRLVAYGMVIEMVVVVFSLPTMLAAPSDDPKLRALLAMLGALGAVIAQATLVHGLFKFSSQPSSRPTAGLAQAAGTLGLVGIAIGFCVFCAFYRAKSVLPDSDDDAIGSLMLAAGWMSGFDVVARVIGLFALVLFLAAIQSVAAHFKRVELVHKARTATVLVLVATAVFAFIELGYAPRQEKLLVGAVVLSSIAQLAAFAATLATARRLIDVLRFDASELAGAGA